MYKDVKIEQETLDVLKADDTLNRIYHQSSAQRRALTCLSRFSRRSGTGRRRTRPRTACRETALSRSSPGRFRSRFRAGPNRSRINRYLTARGDEKSVTLYWYQSHDRIIAGEFAAKFWLIADSIRYHRSDTSLVKVVVPVRDGDADAATKTAVDFVKAIFPPLTLQLPM